MRNHDINEKVPPDGLGKRTFFISSNSYDLAIQPKRKSKPTPSMKQQHRIRILGSIFPFQRGKTVTISASFVPHRSLLLQPRPRYNRCVESPTPTTFLTSTRSPASGNFEVDPSPEERFISRMEECTVEDRFPRGRDRVQGSSVSLLLSGSLHAAPILSQVCQGCTELLPSSYGSAMNSWTNLWQT